VHYSKEGLMDVKDVMHTAVTTGTPETRECIAHQVMTRREARIRHLPVVTDAGILIVDNGTLVGVVVAIDGLRAFLHPVRVAERGETSQRTRIPKEP
jgi:CBS-domain-containing membrane protein